MNNMAFSRDSSTSRVECAVCFRAPDTTALLLPCQHTVCLLCGRSLAQEAHARSTVVGGSKKEVETVLLKRGEQEAEEGLGEREGAVEGKESCGGVVSVSGQHFLCPVCGERMLFDLSRGDLGVACASVGQTAPEAACAAFNHKMTASGTLAESANEGNSSSGKSADGAGWMVIGKKKSLNKMNEANIEKRKMKSKLDHANKAHALLCAEHQQPVTKYCVQDGEAVCAECLRVGKHRTLERGHWKQHACRSLEQGLKLSQERMSERVVRCESRLKEVERGHGVVQSGVKPLYESCVRARRAVNEYFDGLVGHIEDVRRAKLAEIDKLYEKNHAVYEAQIGVLGSARAHLRETLAVARRVVEEGVSDVSQLSRATTVVARLEVASVLCEDKLTPVFSEQVEFHHVDVSRVLDNMLSCVFSCGVNEILYRWALDEENVCDVELTRDGRMVRKVTESRGVPDVCGPRLPNHGRHTWRLRLSGGVDCEGDFGLIDVGVSSSENGEHRYYYWDTTGTYYKNRIGRNDDFCRFAATATPEVELTLDSDQHTLTMRRLDNAKTHTMDNIPSDVSVYIGLAVRGNCVEFIV